MDYKTIFVVDPVKNERIQLSKFIKHDKFTVMAFLTIADCFKKGKQLTGDLIVYVYRPGKADLDPILKIKDKYKKIPLIILTDSDPGQISLTSLEENGFSQIYKAGNSDKVREIAYEILAPDGLVPRPETPHPVPIT